MAPFGAKVARADGSRTYTQTLQPNRWQLTKTYVTDPARDFPLIRVLGEQVAAEVTRMHKDAGVDLRMSSTLADHPDLADAPVTLVAVGVTPTVEWLDGSGIDVDNGISCDASGRTSVPHVWAMGDVAAWRDARTGRPRRFEHWTSAAFRAEAREWVADRLASRGVTLTGQWTQPHARPWSTARPGW